MLTGLSQGALSVAFWASCVFPLHSPEFPSSSGLPCPAQVNCLKSVPLCPSPMSAPVASTLPGTPARLLPSHSALGPACLHQAGLRLGVLRSQSRGGAEKGAQLGRRAKSDPSPQVPFRERREFDLNLFSG